MPAECKPTRVENMKRMIAFVRHAQAGSGFRDHERHLTGAGRDQAVRVGQALSRYFDADTQTVASSARRTQETALAIANVLGTDHRSEEKLYSGDEDDVLACTLTNADVIVVGHAPVIAYAALDVASRISTETTEQVGERGCPTGTAFIFRAEGELGAERYEWVDTVITPARG